MTTASTTCPPGSTGASKTEIATMASGWALLGVAFLTLLGQWIRQWYQNRKLRKEKSLEDERLKKSDNATEESIGSSMPNQNSTPAMATANTVQPSTVNSAPQMSNITVASAGHLTTIGTN